MSQSVMLVLCRESARNKTPRQNSCKIQSSSFHGASLPRTQLWTHDFVVYNDTSRGYGDTITLTDSHRTLQLLIHALRTRNFSGH
jgi:hypothetical protein